jgi:hypothetical protein
MMARAPSRSTEHSGVVDLATLLARAYLRLAKTSRPSAVSSPAGEQISLDESPCERPDVVPNPRTRRAS